MTAMNREVFLADVPHREELVAEVHFNREQLAEVYLDDSGRVLVGFFPRPLGDDWALPLEEVLEGLTIARDELLRE